MTSTALARQSATISTNAARLAMGAIVAYQLLLSALIFLRPDLAPSWHTISEWAIERPQHESRRIGARANVSIS
jgi:hypothetical protein